MINKLLLISFLIALVALVGMGCNTANGFGKDVSDAGQGIQNGTK
jgi:predicted small secreted protein